MRIIRHLSRQSSNTYLIEVSEKEVVLIDPGFPDILEEYLEILKSYDKIHVVHTHMHYDHIASTAYLRELFGKNRIIVYHHEKEAKYLELGDSITTLASAFKAHLKPIKVDYKLREGFIVIGDEIFAIYHTPGHTIGSIAIQYKDILFTGDTILEEGIGRTDLPTGSRVMLYESLKKLEKIKANIIAPGHGRVIRGKSSSYIRDLIIGLGPFFI